MSTAKSTQIPIRLSATGRQALDSTADRLGVSRATVVEGLLFRFAPALQSADIDLMPAPARGIAGQGRRKKSGKISG